MAPSEGGIWRATVAAVSLLLSLAMGAGLDQIEVGGPWGSPTATGGTAPWWNPAGMAMDSGHRYQLELAPSFAVMEFTRDEPNGGSDRYTASGVLPQFGFASDFGIDGLGIGAAIVVPKVRGGNAGDPISGPGRYTMKSGRVQTIYGMVGMGFRPIEQVSVGGVVAVVNSRFLAEVNKDSLPDLAAALDDAGEVHEYTDEDLEQPEYAIRTEFQAGDIVMTAGASLMLRPHPKLDVGVTYLHGPTVQNVGTASLAFACPPQEDTVGRFAAESRGMCDTDITSTVAASYTLPNRVHGGVTFRPNLRWRVEAMGGWVGWSSMDDVTITLSDTAERNPDWVAAYDAAEETANEVIDGKQVQTRSLSNAVWGAVDAKWTRPVLGSRPLTLGGRVGFDQSAVPDHTLATNNFDADILMLTGMASFGLHPALTLGGSWTHSILETRTTQSAYYQSVESPNPEPGYNHPHTSGTYDGHVNRFGVHLRGAF